MDGVQHIKFPLHKLVQVLLLKEKQVPLPLVAAEQASGLGHPFIQPVVDLSQDAGSLILRQVLHQVLVIVDEQNGRHRPGGVEFVPYQAELGDIHPIGGG